MITFLKQSDLFQKGRLRIIAPDLRGYGESATEEPPSSLAEYADELTQLLDALKIEEPVVYVGFSMGGYIFWPFLQKYMNRLKGIALLDTRAADDTEEGRATRLKMAKNVEAWGSARVAQLMRPNLFSEEHSDHEVVEQTLSVIAETAPKTIAASQIGMAARPNSTDKLSTIKVPTRVIVGEADKISTVEEMRLIAKGIHEAELTVIEKAGHMTPVERPEEVANAILRLIKRIDD